MCYPQRTYVTVVVVPACPLRCNDFYVGDLQYGGRGIVEHRRVAEKQAGLFAPVIKIMSLWLLRRVQGVRRPQRYARATVSGGW